MRSELPYWATSSFLAEFEVIDRTAWKRIWRKIIGGADSYLYILRPIRRGAWLIYAYGADHFRGHSYPHFVGKIAGTNSAEEAARKIPALHKRPMILLEDKVRK